MTRRFRPALDVLPDAQREIWPRLACATDLSLVLYGGTAIALQLAHRRSIDFDFFASTPLRKDAIRGAFDPDGGAAILQDAVETLVLSVPARSGPVKLSFFGGLRIGRVGEPLRTEDGVLIVASLEDLLSTKLKTILDRAEAKDYRDIAAMLRSGLSLAAGLAAFRAMYGGEPAQVLRAIGFFEDGDLASLSSADRQTLAQARDEVRDLPEVEVVSRSLS